MKIMELKPGDVLVRGNQERLIRGIDSRFVIYQSKTDIRRKRVTGIPHSVFAEWMSDAEYKEKVEVSE